MEARDDQSYSSRSILNLDALITNCRDENTRFVLFAKKAGSLARFSCIDEARSLVKELRAANGAFDPQLSGWIILAEGLIEHFDSLNNVKSKDKFNRALLVGQMAGDRELAGTAAAWMAHCELVSGQISAASNQIVTAFKWSDENSYDARGRASMVLGDALNWAGQTELARKWYRDARNYAIREGDIAMQNVMLFNLAAFGVANLTLLDCSEPTSAEAWKWVSLEVASAANLNHALGIQSLSSLIPMMRAELFVVKRQWKEASALFEAHMSRVVADGQKRLLPKIISQLAWCQANLGDMDEAFVSFRKSVDICADCTDLDDLAVLHFRLSGVGKLILNQEIQNYHATLAAGYLTRFRNQQAEMFEKLRDTIEKVNFQIKNPT